MIPGNASGLSTLKENKTPFLCNSVFLCPVIVGAAVVTAVLTRKHYSKMRTAHSEIIHASFSVATTRCCF